MHTVDHRHDVTDRDAVEALAATLDLPRGQVGQDELMLWSERVTAQGWVVDEHTDDHYLLRRPDSGFRADLHLLRYTPDDAEHPLLTPDDGGALRYAFSTVRLSDPDGTGLLADANLTQAPPTGRCPGSSPTAARRRTMRGQRGSTRPALTRSTAPCWANSAQSCAARGSLLVSPSAL
jgi:hypothetical protein